MRRSLALPIALSAAVIACALFSQSSVRDALTGSERAGIGLTLPGLYVVLSPVSRVLDTVGLLSARQLVALFVTIILAAALRGPGKAAAAFVIIVVLYTCAGALPRPMAQLTVADSSLVSVDFHSHTNASSDARKAFSPEQNRLWHQRGGFDAAYVSDHRTFAGAEAAMQSNPVRAGDGTVLLSGYEGRYLGTFEIFLSVSRADSAALITQRRWLQEGLLQSGRVPVSVVAMPGPLSDVQAPGRDSAPHISAIEISDGSPRGSAQIDRDRTTLVRRADSLGLALVSGSNNHGWGRVVPAWTLVRIPGWRALSPALLAAAIENSLRENRGAIAVVERRRPRVSSVAALALTAPIVAGQILRTLMPVERGVWLVWIWLAWALAPWAQALTRITAKPS